GRKPMITLCYGLAGILLAGIVFPFAHGSLWARGVGGCFYIVFFSASSAARDICRRPLRTVALRSVDCNELPRECKSRLCPGSNPDVGWRCVRTLLRRRSCRQRSGIHLQAAAERRIEMSSAAATLS